MKQQTNTPTPSNAPLSAVASAEEMSPPPELQGSQGNQGKGQKEGTDEEISCSPELHGNRQERERLEKRATLLSAFASGEEASRATPSPAFVSGEETSSPAELHGNRQEQERERE
jgi:hypothetical protein